MKTINIYGAKGGIGTTTTAVVLSAMLARNSDYKIGICSSENSELSDIQPVLGIPAQKCNYKVTDNLIYRPESTPVDYLIIDNGFAKKDTFFKDNSIFIIDNSYLSLRRATILSLGLMEIEKYWIKIIKNDNCLTGRDVSEVIGINESFATEIEFSSKISRSVDAGTIGIRPPKAMHQSLIPVIKNILK